MADVDTAEFMPEGDELGLLRKKLETAENQIADYKRLIADFENARKRLARDTEQNKKYASESLVRDLLMALDNLDRALDAAKQAGETGPLASGVSATASQFLDVFKRHGVTRMEIGPETVFDPNLHQAVQMVPSKSVKPGNVVQVLQQGFLLHDRVLRPASVIIAAAE